MLLMLLCRSSPVSAQLPVVPAIDSLYDTMCVLTVSSWSRRHADVQRGSQLFFRRYALIIDQASVESADHRAVYYLTDSYTTNGYDPSKGITNIPDVGGVRDLMLISATARLSLY